MNRIPAPVNHRSSPDNHTYAGPAEEDGVVDVVLMSHVVMVDGVIPSDRWTAGSKPAQGAKTGHLSRARYVLGTRTTGSPTGREPYGDGAPIVVRGWESQLQGKGGQEVRQPRKGRNARCAQPKPS
jgi:hypothetical protein